MTRTNNNQRFVLAVGLLGLVAFAGFQLAGFTYYLVQIGLTKLLPNWARIEWVTAPIGLAVVVGLLKETFQLIAELRASIADITRHKMVVLFVRVFFLAFGAALAFLAVQNKPPSFAVLPAYPVYLSEGTKAPMAIVPILFSNAARDKEGKFEQGVDVDEKGRETVAEVVKRLRTHCDSSVVRSIELRAAGSASSREFAGTDAETSQRLNVMVTNLRTSALRKTLDDATNGDQRFDVKSQDTYATYPELVRRRPYIDRIGANVLDTAEDLNRRADIEILAAGACTTRTMLLEHLARP